MSYVLYERPREKLRHRGLSSLSLAELLQLIIGSGSPGASGARLARLVEAIILEDALSYDSLIALSGLGDAKACQILAVFEIVKRAKPYG